MTDFIPYPKTIKKDIWHSYLGRALEIDEISILDDLRSETVFNEKIKALHIIAEKKGYYLPKLTKLHGNCLFESLAFYNICSDRREMRCAIATLLRYFKNHKGLFNDPRSPKDIFNDINDVTKVLCKSEDRAYVYTYDIMCRDLANDFSWTRLPTQLILMFLSKLFNLSFTIVSNMSEYAPVINENPEGQYPEPIKVILGHIGETHYVPLYFRSGHPDENILLYHNDAKKRYFQWAKFMEQIVNDKQQKINNWSQETNPFVHEFSKPPPYLFTETQTNPQTNPQTDPQTNPQNNSQIEQHAAKIAKMTKVINSEPYTKYCLVQTEYKDITQKNNETNQVEFVNFD